MLLADRNKGIALSIIGVLVLSPDSLLIRLANLEDYTLLFYRGLFPAMMLSVLLLIYYRFRFLTAVVAMGWAGLANGVLYAGTNITFIHSIQQTSVANTIVILSSAPVFAALLSLIFLKENQRFATWIAIVFSLLSIFIIGYGSYSSGSIAGDVLALACAATTGSSAVLARYKKRIDLVPSIIIGSTFVALYALFYLPDLSVNTAQLIYVGIIGFVIIPIAFMLLTIAPRFTSSAEVQLVFLLESIIAPLWVWIVINETPSLTTLVGGAMLLTSVAGFAWSLRKEDTIPAFAGSSR